MVEENLPVPVGPPPEGKSFEQSKSVNEHGAEYWSARDLQPLLGYNHWRSFEKAIAKAITSCQQSGNEPDHHFARAQSGRVGRRHGSCGDRHHFARARKVVALGSGSEREVVDFHLSRFACYLVAQNGDPRKPEIALAQKYFAIQTRRQELSDARQRELERLELRKQTTEEFKALSGAARNAGVHSTMFGIFHDAGYKGLYGGLGSEQIKAHKRIAASENLLDRMGTTELAANQFRMTQTREKLAKEDIHGPEHAIDTHRQVGKEVREAIRRIGGTMPESLPPAEDIKQVEKRLRQSTRRLELDGPDAKGLTGPEQKK
jgi:DNA-damage-inducible protein D